MASILAATAFALLHGSATYALPPPMPMPSQLHFKAGEEPFKARHERGPGQARLCSPGRFKATAGTYSCKPCANGSIAPKEGATNCQPCPSMMSDTGHTYCLDNSSARDLADPAATSSATAAATATASAATAAATATAAVPTVPTAATPTAVPTVQATATPTAFVPTVLAAATPTAAPTVRATGTPTAAAPTVRATATPTNTPTAAAPTVRATATPTAVVPTVQAATTSTAAAPKPAAAAAAAGPTNVTKLDYKALANIPLAKKPCTTEESGSQRCQIPVGWWDNDRSGTVFFPGGYENTPTSYMLLLHGSGWTGSEMINIFKAYAIKYRFAIIAPDSHNALYWAAPKTAADDFTADFWHIQACWDSVMNKTTFPGVVAVPNNSTSFGNSFASYAATSFATRSTINFTSAAILHAAALPQQMGPRVMPFLWVTGNVDPLYGIGPATIDVANFRKEKPQYPISWEIWQDSHTIRNYTQIEHMVNWWLDPAIRNDPIQTN